MTEGRPANTSYRNNKPRVYRLRNLPEHIDRLAAVKLLCEHFEGIKTEDVEISWPAYDVDSGARLRTKVATLTFLKEPPALNSILKDEENSIPVPWLEKALIIDHHFQGLTPLNHVPDHEHEYDCVAISGLASHPFGSWQPHGRDKSFMWIRDELPQRLPGVRFLVYGYNTTLSCSTSFQVIPDLAISLVQTMKAGGWSAPSAKPLLFLAHSLGGVVLKQALVILAGGDDQGRAILAKIKGAIFFGVPSKGMSIPDILKMVGDQPNKELVKDLSDKSDFLSSLDRQFGNITWLGRLHFFWAFETKITPIVEETPVPGNFARTGPGTIMVSRDSATRNLCHTQPSSTIQIDDNHSDMVKFGRDHHSINILASKLKSICGLSDVANLQLGPQLIRSLSHREAANPTVPPDARNDSSQGYGQQRTDPRLQRKLPDVWDDDEILASLRSPERDRRLEQIDQKVGATFNWAYDGASVRLSEWLQKGTGIFWINGKPASGKSTLMKYLHQDPRTEELLGAGSWHSTTRLVKASFFFHHRGTNRQKSFDGLLSSLVSQILEQENTLFPLLYPILERQYQTKLFQSKLDNLEEDLWKLLDRVHIHRSSHVASGEVEKLVSSQRELTNSRQLGIHLKRMLIDLGVKPGDADDDLMLGEPEPIRLTKSTRELNQWQRAELEKWWDWFLGGTLKRQYQRDEIRRDIQSSQWSKANLEDCLRRLIGQSQFKMDLFLFLDALDEYNGSPEFIASFLRSLVQQPVAPIKQTSTRIKILFSSRPWKAFNDEFAANPGFQIQDYTINDIKEFCAASIPPDAKPFLPPFIKEIAGRACGVFLWVKLVMRDLTKTVRGKVQLLGPQGLKQEIRKTLDELPDELEDYYQIIVKRMQSRWESYVVLETLCRSAEDIEPDTMLAIVKCSQSNSFTDAKHRLEQDSQTRLQGPGLASAETLIEHFSGGLAEVSKSYDGKGIVQFMHQTVKQFVINPLFRTQLLGNEFGTCLTENGHSFIAKHFFITADDRFAHYAREAEKTTGSSQYDLFSEAPPRHFSLCRASYPSMIAMAVSSKLQLCIHDAHEAKPSCIQRNSAVLLPILLAAPADEDEDMLEIAEFLVSKGLSMDESADYVFKTIQLRWKGSKGLQEKYERVAMVLVDAIPRTSTSTEAASSQSFSIQTITGGISESVAALFHQSRPRVVRKLLARGFSANSLDTEGLTPLDTMLAGDISSSQFSPDTLLHHYDIISQLILHGGLLGRFTSKSRWDAWESLYARSGLDIGVFQEAGFPLWQSGSDSSWRGKTGAVGRKKRKLR